MNTVIHSDLNDNIFMIACENIILREYRYEDLDAIHALTMQPEIIEFLPDWNVPKEQRRDWLVNYELVDNNRFLAAAAESGNVEQLRLRLGIILQATGEFIGWCCTGIKEELPPPSREIMFAISSEHRNKGYTTQAVQGLVKYLFENTNVEELNAIALPRNLSSNRVIQKSGFDFLTIMMIEGEAYNHYKLVKRKD
ncbi:GNAT family N-acetyltransferase [Paenibacillus spongiae]|uniref:GNAT family N-acetyltransferase n=1 Tax=Paenibacillus spongiae TaxID=2909671 RepID=A0ABY5SGS7_9BACL|nr:GNAT family N-acetyltransferase [Paenibacillus spongiae]UVI33151.1 GNAT family N-acetyltransferase [Paenibacillus spongiae]